MKAIGFNQPLPISDERSLVDIELPDPEPGPNDLLVAVEAIAVNPADTKVRASARPAAGSWRILGWDAVGTVRAVGRDVSVSGWVIGCSMREPSTGPAAMRSCRRWMHASPRMCRKA